MNQQAFESGRQAYRSGDFNLAVTYLAGAKGPGEVSGAVDHLLGNCLMKLGRYDEAAAAYADALRDPSYGHAGALACNRGRALLAAGKPQDAIASLTMATRDGDYPTPYKAYVALGNAYRQTGNIREAGVAYRNAAIDENNPDPSGALRNLGGCFMQMGRAVDAVEAYRTALDFSSSDSSQNAIYAELGLAYVAANRMAEAVDAFDHAVSDGTYQLPPESQAAFDAAKRAVSAISNGPSETDALLQAAGYGTGAIDPLDPLGKSGEMMPSPDESGFFQISEEQLVEQDKQKRKVERKHKHTGLKVLIVILVILAVICGGGYFAYSHGYGWPTQESVVSDLFNAKSGNGDISSYLAGSMSEDKRQEIDQILPVGSTTLKVDGVDRGATESKATVTATLSAGGEQNYEVDLVREGLGWKVSDVSAVYPSQLESGTTVSDAGSTTTTGTVSDGDASASATDSSAGSGDASSSDASSASSDSSTPASADASTQSNN